MEISTKDFGEYTVKNVKQFNGREGTGYNANLYRGTKKVAEVIDSGNGGEAMIYWDDNSENALLQTHISKFPKVKFENTNLTIDQGWFISDCVAKFELDKQINKLKKQMSVKTFFRAKTHKEGQYAFFNVPCDDKLRDTLRKKYGSDVEIFNDVVANGGIPSVFA